MKLLGAGLVWITLIYAGAVYSINLKSRIVLLENTLLMIHEMKMHLQYLNIPVYEMISEMKTKEYFNKLIFLGECCRLIDSGKDFPIAWKKAIEECNLHYMTDERNKLLHLGKNLGTSDLENQIKILDIHTNYFEKFLDKAKSKQQKYGNMILMLSMLSGCMVFIMVI